MKNEPSRSFDTKIENFGKQNNLYTWIRVESLGSFNPVKVNKYSLSLIILNRCSFWPEQFYILHNTFKLLNFVFFSIVLIDFWGIVINFSWNIINLLWNFINLSWSFIRFSWNFFNLSWNFIHFWWNFIHFWWHGMVFHENQEWEDN